LIAHIDNHSVDTARSYFFHLLYNKSC